MASWTHPVTGEEYQDVTDRERAMLGVIEMQRSALAVSADALRQVTVVAVAASGKLMEPFEDAPSRSPWTVTWQPLLRQVEHARKAARAAMGGRS